MHNASGIKASEIAADTIKMDIPAHMSNEMPRATPMANWSMVCAAQRLK
jgi:hypothetical protein